MVKLVLRPVGKVLEVSLWLLGRHWLHSFRVVEQALLIYHILKPFLGGFEVVPPPVKGLLADDFLLFVVQAIEVRMGQALLDSVPFIRVEGEHFREKVGRCGFDVWEEFLPVLLGPFRERFDILDCILVSYAY